MKLPQEMSSDRKISIAQAIITINFAMTAIYYYWRGMFLQMGFPANTFLPGPATRFGDFYGGHDHWLRQKFNGIDYAHSYFPSTYIFLDIFTLITEPYYALVLFQTIFCCFFAFYIYRNTKSTDSVIESVQRIIVFSVMTYPFLITFHTANLEAIIFFLLALFLYYFQRNEFYKCAIPLGIAISMKMIPGLFIVLLIAKGKIKATFLTIAVIILASLLPLVIYDGAFNSSIVDYFSRLQASQKMYFDLMVYSGAGNIFGHSLLNSLRIAFPSFPPMTLIFKGYSIFALLAALGIAFYTIRVEKILWKQVTLVTCGICLLPYTSTDYKLLHFFLPFCIFLNAKNQDGHNDYFYLILFTLILIPKNYFYSRGDPFLNFNGLINTTCMVVLIILIVSSNSISRKKEDKKITA